MQNKKREWEIKGFIDDNTKALDGYNYDVKIIGTIKDYSPEPDDIFAMAIGLPIADKLSVGEMLLNKGASFISVIHPTAQVN